MSEKKKSLTTKQRLMKLPQILLDFLVISYWGFYDIYLGLKYRKKSPYVDIHIMSENEKRFFFPNDGAGGYAGIRLIKIFILPNSFIDEFDTTCDILNHEILHQVLNNVISYKAKVKLDKIQKAIYVYNYETKKWSYRIAFSVFSKGKLITWIDE
jgi:hypothetical protein